jgi:type I restriction enzyme S subunit
VARVEHLMNLRRTIVNLAVDGRLTAHSQSIIERPTGELPKGWELVHLGDLLIGDSQNGYSRKPDDDPGGVQILRISAGTIRKDGIVAEEEFKLIGGVSPAIVSQYALRAGDLLACRFNGNREFVGRFSEYRGYLRTTQIYPDKLIRLRLCPARAFPSLIRYFAQSDFVRHEIEEYCATTVGNWGISATNLKRVRIPLPPLVEQHQIVAKVDELMAVCDRLEAQLTAGEAVCSHLLDALLHEALIETAAVS